MSQNLRNDICFGTNVNPRVAAAKNAFASEVKSEVRNGLFGKAGMIACLSSR